MKEFGDSGKTDMCKARRSTIPSSSHEVEITCQACIALKSFQFSWIFYNLENVIMHWYGAFVFIDVIWHRVITCMREGLEMFCVILRSLVVQGDSTPLKVWRTKKNAKTIQNLARERIATENVEEKRQQPTKIVESNSMVGKPTFANRKIEYNTCNGTHNQRRSWKAKESAKEGNLELAGKYPMKSPSKVIV